jgi:hypothetical protein
LIDRPIPRLPTAAFVQHCYAVLAPNRAMIDEHRTMASAR